MRNEDRINVTRAMVAKRLLATLRAVKSKRGGGYFVKRGPIAWSDFTWPQSQAISVRFPENHPEDSGGMRTAMLELVVMARINQENQEADDDTLEVLETEVLMAVDTLRLAKVDKTETALITLLKHAGSVELADVERKIQGWFITFDLEY